MTVLTGKIENIFPEEKRGNFRFTNIWLQEQNVSWPNTWQISLFNDDKDWLKYFRAGDMVSINVAVLGKKVLTQNNQEVVYTTIRAVKIQKLK